MSKRETINSKIYVDKTEFIQFTNELINTRQKFICISRPRRFGKSITAEMMAAYYGKGYDSNELFCNYKIAHHADYQKHLNQYHVIMLNMQNFLSRTKNIEDMLHSLQKKIIRDLKKSIPCY